MSMPHTTTTPSASATNMAATNAIPATSSDEQGVEELQTKRFIPRHEQDEDLWRMCPSPGQEPFSDQQQQVKGLGIVLEGLGKVL